MIQLQSVTLSLNRRRVLDCPSLTLTPGQVIAVIGPNGAGKTSLLRGVAGLLVPETGQITLDGDPIANLPAEARARRIGYLPQNGTPAWGLTVKELVALGRLPHRSAFAAPSDADKQAIARAMERADVNHLAERRIDRLSGGERARAKLARVLAGEPDWILADEPLANLDPPHQQDLLALFSDAAARGTGIIMVVHQLDAATRADCVVALASGHIIADGPAEAVLTPALLQQTFGMAFAVHQLDGQSIILPARHG